MTARLSPHLAGIRRFACETSHDPQQLLTVCRVCGLPLRVDYDLSSVKLSLRDLQARGMALAVSKAAELREGARKASLRAY